MPEAIYAASGIFRNRHMLMIPKTGPAASMTNTLFQPIVPTSAGIAVLNTISEARRAMETKNYSLVIDKLKGIVQEEPQLVDTRYMLANAYLHVGDKELALKEFLNTIKLNPAHEQTLYNLGYFYQTEGDPTASEYWYKQLLKQQPEQLFGNLNLAKFVLPNGTEGKSRTVCF